MKINNILELTDKPKYNWFKIWKECKKLGTPNFVWNPYGMNMNNQAYIVDISRRSTGKTTSWLITALVMNKLYGSTFAYMRQKPQQITPKICGKIFDTLREFGYIEKITDGQYKDIYLWGGVFRYCNRDDKTQKVTEQSEPIGYTLAVSESEVYKSNFNVNNCDLIIYDEFISSVYLENEFELFTNLLSTVGRQRAEFYIVMLGNTLNYYNMYLQELGITRDIRTMQFGDKKIITSGMVNVYVELIDMTDKNKTKIGRLKEQITLFRFGFGNSRINAITGDSWNIKQYPHVPDFVDVKKDRIFSRFIVNLNVDYVMGTCYKHNGKEYIVFTPYRTQPRNDIRVYKLTQPRTELETFGMGWKHMDKIIWGLILNTDRVYFATNETGLIIDEYIQRANTEHFI